MMWSHDCTIYQKQGETSYLRMPVKGVHWQDTKGVNFNRTGASGVDSVSVQIPLENANLDGWNTAAAWYIVRGLWEDEITDTASLKSFLAKKPFTVTSVAKNDYSVAIGDHWNVGAK